MKDAFAYAGGALLLLCSLPYVVDIVKGKTKPNVVTWLTWSILNGIGAAALFASSQPHAALLLVGDFVGTMAVVGFGLKYGVAKLDRFDIFCQVAAVVGIILWVVLDEPIVAIAITVSVDIIGTVPTLRHAWSHPEEETAITFLLGAVATVLTLISLKEYSITAIVYPAYLLVSNVLLYCVIRSGKLLQSKLVR